MAEMPTPGAGASPSPSPRSGGKAGAATTGDDTVLFSETGAAVMAAAGAGVVTAPDMRSPAASVPIDRESDGQASRMLLIRLVPLTLVILLAALAAVSFIAIKAFEREILPEVDAKATAVGQAVGDTIELALQHGIPLAGLVGMAPYLDSVESRNAELAYLAVTSPTGTVLHAAVNTPDRALALLSAAQSAEAQAALEREYRDIAIPLRAGSPEAPLLGVLHVGVDQAYVTAQLTGIIYDILTVALVALLVAFEFLFIIVVVFVTGPMRQLEHLMRRAQAGDFTMVMASDGGEGDEVKRLGRAYNAIVRRIGDAWHELLQDAAEVRAAQFDTGAVRRIEGIVAGMRRRFAIPTGEHHRASAPSSLLRVRVPLFLFIFAEEMTRPFLPLYVQGFQTSVPWLTEAMVLALPISVFMLAVAVITPFAGVWTDRIGTRRVFLLGAIPSVVGYLGSAAAVGVPDLLVWRSLSGLGYAIVYIACQGYVAIHSASDRKVSGMAVFMGAVFAAAICGPSIGGILAERLGPRVTLEVSAALVALASLLIHGLLKGTTDASTTGVRRQIALRDVMTVLRNGRLVSLLLFSAIPAKILLTGVLFYLAPLYLTELGESQSSIGRIIMVYGLMNVLVTPLAARIADRVGNLALLVGGGAVLSGLGAMGILMEQSAWMVLLAVFAMGLAHAVAISPQLVLVQEVCAEESRTLGQTTVLSVFRLIERLGNIIGPFLVGAMVTVAGYGDAMALTGLLVMVTGVLFLLTQFLLRGSRRAEVPS